MFAQSLQTTKSFVKKEARQDKRGTVRAYTHSPDVEFNIDEFESYAISRLNVLRWIEKQTGLGQSIDDQIGRVLIKHNLHTPLNDEISHFIGRLCFCQTVERRRWYLKTEKVLFEARYKMASDADKLIIHKELCGGYSSYQTLTKQMIINDIALNGKTPIPNFKQGVTLNAEKEMLPFYKVPFEEVISLIGRRSVYLSNGFAYVPNNKFFSLITGKFRSHLNRGLVSAQKAIDKMKSDPVAMDCVSRVIHIIDGLHKMTSGPTYKLKKNKSKITHKEVNKLSNIHFPLCMQSSMEHMRADGHLKHGGRMHLGLFLKGIGLSLNEAMIFWRNSFKKIGGDKFNKQYSYNVRHNYGKEGKRIDYTPYSCNKIIGCSPGGDDYHGCPFKIFDVNNLKKYLSINKKMNSNDVQMVADLVKGNHYQLACRSYFAYQHREVMKRKNVSIDDVQSQWSHPNEYFDHSYKLYHGEKKNEEEDGKTDGGGDVQMDNTANGGMNVDSQNNNNHNTNNNSNGMNIDTPH